MGEQFSSTCLSILLLRQCQLTDTDSQIVTINLEFDPKAANAEENFSKCKAALVKFQHTKSANHQNIHQTSNHSKVSATSTFITSIENGDEYDQEQVDSIKTFLSTRGRRGGRGGGRGGGAGGGAGQGEKKSIPVLKS